MVLVDFSFYLKGEKIKISVRECKSLFSHIKGLMFSKSNQALLFIFQKETFQPIHSFFCKPFIAVWFNNNKIVDIKKVDTWKLSIKPREKFNKLLEIPIGNPVYETIYEIPDGMRKI